MVAAETEPRLRIALSVHHHLDWNSGAPGAAMALAQALQNRGQLVELLSFDNLPAWIERLPLAVRSRLQPVVFPWFVASRLRGRLKEFDVCDLLSGDGWRCYSFRNGRGARAERPLFVTYGQGLEHVYQEAMLPEAKGARPSPGIRPFLSRWYDAHSHQLRLWEVRQSYERADVGLFVNHADRAFAVERFRIRSDRTRVTANGIPDSLLGLAPPRRLARSRLVVAQIGSYVARKGVHYGSQALSHVMTRRSNVHARFLGTGCSCDRVLSDFAPELHGRIDVIPQYRRDELPRLLADCEIKLFPTLAEGFGMALVEAMACGLAPVSTLTPGPMSIIEPDVDGVLVPPRDPAALAAALKRLVADEDLRLRIRKNAYEKAQRYGWDAVAAQRTAIYREFLDRRSAAVRAGRA